MEVMEAGYKKTEIGMIPSDWNLESIASFAKITTGAKDTQDRNDSGKYPFYVRSQKVERIESFSLDTEAVLTSGDGVGVGKIYHYINGKFDFHQRVYCMYNFKEEVYGKYFFYQFTNKFYERVMSMTAKSSVDSVRREMIADMKLPLPPIQEQRAIATALSDVDALIQKLDDLIQKKQDIKKATMQLLLTGKKRLDGFENNERYKMTEIGLMPSNWKVKKLSQLFVIRAGGDLDTINFSKEKDDKHNYPIYANSINNKGLYGYTSIPRYKSGSVTVTARGSLGHAEFRDHAFDAIVRLLVLEPQTDINPYLFAEIINNNVEFAYESTGVPQLTAPQIGGYYVGFPNDVSEQNAIAQILFEMDIENHKLKSLADKYRKLKKGMMQELLTGKTRLV